MTTRSEPIIQSLLDTDFYKFTMGSFITSVLPGRNVTFELFKRTSRFPLAEYIDEKQLREELDHVRSLFCHLDEGEYLYECGIPRDYVTWFREFKLPEYSLEVTPEKEFSLKTTGPWEAVSLWETFALSIINELFVRKMGGDTAYATERLAAIKRTLEAFPAIRVSDFGTRRRASRLWHEIVFSVLHERIQTSNVLLAKKFGRTPVGTMAHELFMVEAARHEQSVEMLRASQIVLTQKWVEHFGYMFLVLLPDTYGSSFLLEHLPLRTLRTYEGIRQDSGDPFRVGEKIITAYRDVNINPNTKSIYFSDGLTLDKIIKLYLHFNERIKCSFGWGTHLTNNIGAPLLSLVMKASEVDGIKTVKLSDNPAKAIGPAEKIKLYAKAFDYFEGRREECIV